MNSKWFHFAAVPVLAGGLLMAAAPETSKTEPPSQAVQTNRQQWRARRAERIAQYLNLTDAQKTQAKAVWQDARQSALPVRQQLKQTRQAMRQAIKANDTAQIQQLSTQEGTLMGQLMNIRGDAFAKIYQTLTPEQRAKADQLPAHFRQHMQSHNRSNG